MNKIPLTKVWNHLQPGQRKVMLCAAISVLSACSSLSDLDSGKTYTKDSYTSSVMAKSAQPDSDPADSDSESQGQDEPMLDQSKSKKTTTPAVQESVKVSSSVNQISDTAIPEQPVVMQKSVPQENAEKVEKVSATKKSKQVSDSLVKKELSRNAGKPHEAQITSHDQRAAADLRSQEPDSVTQEKPFNSVVTLELLPLRIGKNWILNRETASSGRCALFYREQVMNDGQGETPVRLVIDDSSMRFNTKSNIDLSYRQTGITLDNQTQIPIERELHDTAIVYEKSFGAIVKAMKTTQQLTLSLGFWPTWPVTQAYHLEFDVSDFSLAYNKLESCVNLEKGLH